MNWEFKCPLAWQVVERWGDGFAVRQREGGLRVLVDCEKKEDGRPWVHVSVSRQDRTPSHDDMTIVKRAFIGEDRYAYSVFPPGERYVNIHKHCLHLWALWEGEEGAVLPEFSGYVAGVGTSI